MTQTQIEQTADKILSVVNDSGATYIDFFKIIRAVKRKINNLVIGAK